MKSIHNVIRANIIRQAWKDAPNGKAKHIMLSYANRIRRSMIDDKNF
jgi:hypothetical protein